MILKQFVSVTGFFQFTPTIGTANITGHFIRLILARKGLLLLPSFVDYCYLAYCFLEKFLFNDDERFLSMISQYKRVVMSYIEIQ